MLHRQWLAILVVGFLSGLTPVLAMDSVLESPSALHRDDRDNLSEEDYLGEPQKFERSGSTESDVEANRWKPGPGYDPDQARRSAAQSQARGQ